MWSRCARRKCTRVARRCSFSSLIWQYPSSFSIFSRRRIKDKSLRISIPFPRALSCEQTRHSHDTSRKIDFPARTETPLSRPPRPVKVGSLSANNAAIINASCLARCPHSNQDAIVPQTASKLHGSISTTFPCVTNGNQK